MNRTDLIFERPNHLAATTPIENLGHKRDDVRLMVSDESGHQHTHFLKLADHLQAGDVLVVNESATLPASLPAHGELGKFIVNLSTDYGNQLWLAEPRWSAAKPGPLPLNQGDLIQVAGLPARLITPYPGLARLWFIQFDGDIQKAMKIHGQPIHYGYVENPPGLAAYQTIFSLIPGSAEMPSAARPFTRRVLETLRARQVEVLPILLHTGVSSLEVETDIVEEHPLYPEPFWVPGRTARAINRAKQQGRRVIAVGTTVVRALESAWNGENVSSVSGFTRLYVHPKRGVQVIDGLITGMHDPVTSHLAMLYAIAGQNRILDAYQEATQNGYLWHEFGDTHLIFR